MPITLSSEIIREKNKLAGGGAFLILIEVYVPGLDQVIRITSDNRETEYKGETYVPFPFEIAEITDNSKGQIPTVELRVSNISRALESYIQQFDLYSKVHGYREIEMRLMVVHSNHLDEDPIVSYEFAITKISSSPYWVTFTLGAKNPYNIRFPQEKIRKMKCRYKKFKDEFCGYSGDETWCDRTLARCRELGNSSRFGGFPGIGRTPLYV